MLGDDELELAAAVFTQIGDVLAVIAVQRSICSAVKIKKQEQPEKALFLFNFSALMPVSNNNFYHRIRLYGVSVSHLS